MEGLQQCSDRERVGRNIQLEQAPARILKNVGAQRRNRLKPNRVKSDQNNEVDLIFTELIHDSLPETHVLYRVEEGIDVQIYESNY